MLPLPYTSCFLFNFTFQKRLFNEVILFVQAYLACFLILSTFTFHRSLFNHRTFVIQGYLASITCMFLHPLIATQFFHHLILFVQAYLACFLISSTFTSHRSLFNHRIFVIQGSRIWQRCPPRQIHQDNIVEHETSGKQPQKYGKKYHDHFTSSLLKDPAIGVTTINVELFLWCLELNMAPERN